MNLEALLMESKLVLFESQDGNIRLDVNVEEETV